MAKNVYRSNESDGRSLREREQAIRRRTTGARAAKDQDYDEYEDDFYEEERPVRKPRKKKKKRAGCVVALLLVVLLLGGAVFGFFYLRDEIEGGHASVSGDVVVRIPASSTAADIATILMEDGLIGSDLVFRTYVKIMGVSSQFQTGDFQLQGGMGYNAIIKIITTPPPARVEVSVTYPEGISAIRFARLTADAGLCTVEEFLAVANNIEQFSDIPFIAKIIEQGGFDPDTFMKAEGYLAPNTYSFFADETVENIVRRLYEEFDRVISPYYEQMERQGLTVREAITLASLVQSEAGVPAEDGSPSRNQYLVAGVFWNRLQPGSPFPKLGSEVTYWYLQDVIAAPVEFGGYGDLDAIPRNIYNAYHTEEWNDESRTGLPAGPIGSISWQALDAALNPDTADGYYFFVTDSTGKYYYAVTYEEHLRNVDEARRVTAENEA